MGGSNDFSQTGKLIYLFSFISIEKLLTQSHFFVQEIIEETTRKLAETTTVNALIIDNPHTIWSVANVLDLNLTKNQRESAGLLADKIFKHVHPETEPQSCTIFDCKVNRYHNDDLWIVIAAVNKIAHGQPPPRDKMSTKEWIKCCEHLNVV